jgi:hypothetical protein
MPAAALPAHEERACPARRLACPHWGCGMSFAARDAAAHAATCPMAQIDCLWGCGARVARMEMRQHQDSCRRALLRCPGCSLQLRREAARQHWGVCMQMPEMCADCGKLVLRGEMQAHFEACEVIHASRVFTCGICGVEEPKDNSFQAPTPRTPLCTPHPPPRRPRPCSPTAATTSAAATASASSACRATAGPRSAS